MATAYERIRTLVDGGRVHPPAISMWKHFPKIDRDTQRFVDRTVGFQKAAGWDFLKISYNGLYSIEDWGSHIRWPENEHEVGRVTRFGVASARDWQTLPPNSVQDGALAREISATGRLCAEFSGSVPVIGTVFSPLTTAVKMAGDAILDHMQNEPTLLHRGLEVITETTVAFVRELLNAAVDGIFFATQLSTTDRLSTELYSEFGRAYDLKVLEAAGSCWFNILHIHGLQPMFAALEDYPVQAINWHDRSTAMSLSRARAMTDKILIGGVDEHRTLLHGSDQDVARELANAIEQVADGRLIIGPGCVVPLSVDEERIIRLPQMIAGL
ncbi:MAG: uroporphyrinogen decarboxylase [Spirochaetaceae bacterium]|nr:MAG: uroporphyrinogen decarboxylase [Spirochaetaceae bacterium]